MTVDNAVKGLAILTAIPVVLLAIWADSFSRGLERLAKDNPHYDRAPELYKIRLAGICAIFFQFGIFMGTWEVRAQSPVFSNVVFVLAVVAQSWLQASVERKVRKPSPRLRPVTRDRVASEADERAADAEESFEDIYEAARRRGEREESKAEQRLAGDPSERTPAQEMDMAVRAFLWATVGGALYLAGFAVPVLVVGLIARFLDASPAVLTAVVVVSAVVGMLGGVALNFALGAFYLRRMLPAKAIEDSSLKSDITDCFERARIPLPALWVLETGRKREATAMIAGFPSGRGIFKPGIFLSRALLEALTREEVRAVVLHEVAHLRLRHLRGRLGYSVGLVVGLTALATFCVFAASLVEMPETARSFIGLFAAAGAFMVTFRELGRQARRHELEADACSVAELGAGFEELISALRKLDQVNGRGLPVGRMGLLGHPATEMRIIALRARFGDKRATGAANDDSEQGRRAA